MDAPPPHCNRSLAVAFALTGILTSGLVQAQDAVKEQRLSAELAASFQEIREQAKNLPPEERIAKIDKWRATAQPKLDALARSQRDSAKLIAISEPVRPVPVTESDRVTAAIDREFQSIREAKLTPEERIRRIDEAIKKTAPLMETRRQMDAAAAKAAPATRAPSAPPADSSPEGLLAAKHREVLDQAKTMSPEQRIAFIDSKRQELDAATRAARAVEQSHLQQPANSPNPNIQNK